MIMLLAEILFSRAVNEVSGKRKCKSTGLGLLIRFEWLF
jgi:hypothetical protein